MDAAIDALCRSVAWMIPDATLREVPSLQRALVGLLLIGPMCATVGLQVVNFRLAFFAEAVGHSAYTGIAIGFLMQSLAPRLGIEPEIAMVAFGVLVALLITAFRRSSGLPSDAIIGVFSSGIIAFGLCVITYLIQNRMIRTGDSLTQFLLGNILLLSRRDVLLLVVLFFGTMGFQIFAYNRLMFLGVNSSLAQTMGVRVSVYEYAFAALLAVVVMFSIQAIGALLVTAMLVAPAAAARNLARSVGAAFWWGLLVSASSCLGGLLASVHWNMGAGAAVILCAIAWFLVSHFVTILRRQ